MYFKQIFALTIGLLLPTASIKTHEQAVSAQEVKSLYSPVLLSQRGGEKRTLRAASGPDDQGRWRFHKPNDVSWDAMEAQGCTHVGTQIPWRCPRDKIRVEVSAQNSGERYDDRYDRGREEKRTLRAASGPDDQGRWRFYKPNDVSWDAMEAQGCTHVGTQIPWRCSRDKIRVEVSAQSSSDRYDDRYDRGREEKRTLRAASGPDDQGRWRFYKPHDVSDDAMQAQGCSYVGTEIPWRCPRDKVRVEVDSR